MTLDFCKFKRTDINAAKNIHRQGLAITDVEMEALDGARNGAVETAVCEASKKRSISDRKIYRLKPLGLAQR